MQFAKQIVMTLLGIALVAYALDCSAMVTPHHAVECCQSMGCSSQGHTSEDCCKTMPAMHVPFVQPSTLTIASPAAQPTVLAVVPHAVRQESSIVRVSSNTQSSPGKMASDLTPLRI